MKRVTIIGSTGSIGTSALDVIRRLEGEFCISGLYAHSNVAKILSQVDEFRPKYVGLFDERAGEVLRESLPGGVKWIPPGEEGLLECASVDADIVLVAVVGAIGFFPVYRALSLGRRVALANKESLVSFGPLITQLLESGGELLPVDSEHSAIFQCLVGEDPSSIARIVITASGGPFRSRDDLESVTVEDALKHPTWSMGRKITIDSATLMNKGLEVIEACFLFSLPPSRISVVIHPQSIIHSLVEFTDGSMIAQLSLPDMRLPIQYAFTYPQRKHRCIAPLDLASVGRLEFYPPDRNRFPLLNCAFDALEAGGTMPAVLNAANEVAVHAFLDKRLPFTGIFDVVRRVMSAHTPQEITSHEVVLDADRWARKMAWDIVEEVW